MKRRQAERFSAAELTALFQAITVVTRICSPRAHRPHARCSLTDYLIFPPSADADPPALRRACNAISRNCAALSQDVHKSVTIHGASLPPRQLTPWQAVLWHGLQGQITSSASSGGTGTPPIREPVEVLRVREHHAQAAHPEREFDRCDDQPNRGWVRCCRALLTRTSETQRRRIELSVRRDF